MKNYREFMDELLVGKNDYVEWSDRQDAWCDYFHRNVAPGDGVTVNYWTDSHACTVLKRTANTLTIQRDKAILSPDFRPDFVPGGFSGTVINQNEQSYTYEPDPDGQIMKAYWSDRKGGWYVDKCLRLSFGRHEFYDYNF